MKTGLVIISIIVSQFSMGQRVIKVHFLYGSSPKKEYPEESNWFGGKMGGHVGVEWEKDKIISLVPSGDFHLVKSHKERASKFVVDNYNSFYSTFGGNPNEMKKLIITIPISAKEANLLDSITKLYQDSVPYDYAFIGMRCAAATYDLISFTSQFKKYSYVKIAGKYFYPKKLRKKLIKIAKRRGYETKTEEGTTRRNWEKD